ncbi:MAG: 4-(cytidine 5'-diphospho)-2-C-methyl-D-erythritol kinase [Clostridiales bacterium]|nr:4-(cytidine 5'-diphospho)-2-C-methyl-D-erythritol kinase [Clostridiales bacterium]
MRHCFADAYAKINIYLDVLGKRPDGYHELSMIMQSVSLRDVIAARRDTGVSGIRVCTNLEYLPSDDRNIAYKAANAFFEKSDIKNPDVLISIEKKIPVAAGLAGGSADAAAALKALNTLYQTNYSIRELSEIGGSVGADVPFCVYGGTMLAGGIGEKLISLPALPDCFILLVKPNFGMSTSRVFKSLDIDKTDRHGDINAAVDAIKRESLKDICSNMFNLLEQVVIREKPEIQKIKTRLDSSGALGSLMSGSGSTVFGVFDDEKTARKAFNTFKRVYRDTYLTRPISGDVSLPCTNI